MSISGKLKAVTNAPERQGRAGCGCGGSSW